MCLFFFRNDGIVLDNFVRSHDQSKIRGRKSFSLNRFLRNTNLDFYGFPQNLSSFGPAVWHIYTNVLFYYVDCYGDNMFNIFYITLPYFQYYQTLKQESILVLFLRLREYLVLNHYVGRRRLVCCHTMRNGDRIESVKYKK